MLTIEELDAQVVGQVSCSPRLSAERSIVAIRNSDAISKKNLKKSTFVRLVKGIRLYSDGRAGELDLWKSSFFLSLKVLETPTTTIGPICRGD